MADFFTPPPGYPDIPDVPDPPPPKIEDLATSLGIGFSKSGVFGGFLAPLFDILMRWSTSLLAFALTKLLGIFAWLIRVLTSLESDASAGYGQIVSASIYNMLGVNVDPSVVASRAGSAGKQAAAAAMGKAVIGALFSNQPAATGQGVPPSDTAPSAYLGTVMNMELNGWIESWFLDGASGHLLEKYGDLKDGIRATLGIGRLSRQAFAAPMKVLVHDPYLALLNAKYRPKAIAEGTAMSAFLRGSIDRDEMSAILGPQGYTETDIDYLIDQHRRYLPDADVEYLLQRGIWQQADAQTYLQKQGWDPQTATSILQMMQDKSLQKYRVEAVNVATEAYVRGDMDQGSLQSLVNSSGLTDVENSWIMTIANLKRQTHITHLSQGEIQQGILDGIMNLNDLRNWATRVNMSPTDEAYLELMLLFKQAKETVTEAAKAAAAQAKATAAKAKADAAATKAAQALALAPDKGVTVAQAETLVTDGLWTFDQLTAFLTAKGYGGDAIDAIVALLHNKMAATAAKAGTAGTVAAAAKEKGLSLAEVQKAVLAGILSTDDLSAYLTNNGFDASDAQVIVELTQEAVTAADTKAAAKAAAAAKAGSKHIDLSALDRAVRLGITPIDTYNAALTAAGYDAMSITLLDGILNDQIASDKATAAKKAATVVPSGDKAATLTQIEAEVVAGIRPIADYTNALVSVGYSAADQLQLTQLLQLKLNHAQHAAALHADAVGKAVAKGIGLAAAESAVLGGINQISDYQAMLQTLGYDAVDVATLVALLQAKVAAKAAKAGTTPTTPGN